MSSYGCMSPLNWAPKPFLHNSACWFLSRFLHLARRFLNQTYGRQKKTSTLSGKCNSSYSRESVTCFLSWFLHNMKYAWLHKQQSGKLFWKKRKSKKNGNIDIAWFGTSVADYFVFMQDPIANKYDDLSALRLKSICDSIWQQCNNIF